MQWKRRHQNETERLHPDESLVIEAQCFLDGNYLDIAFEEGRDIPVWAWVSIIAHGDTDSVRRASRWMGEHDGVRPEFDMWGRVLQHVARQVLAASQNLPCPLIEIQRQVLVPLELTVMSTPIGPTTLYRLVSSMLVELKTRIETE